tara:strand:- start:1132 stop:1971 length:840 start_codon:yes stop_codon:yes gene_type:complete
MNVFVKKAIFAILALFSVSQGFCSSGSDLDAPDSSPRPPRVSGINSLNFRHIMEEDRATLEMLPASTKARFSNGVEGWFENLLVRQKSNPYTALIFFSPDDQPVAIVGFGIMPHLGYGSEHKDIIDFWMRKGIIRRKENSDEASYEKEEFEQIGNFGIGMMLPLLFEGASDEAIKDAIQGATDAFAMLYMKGCLLPRGGRSPKFVMSLLKTEPAPGDDSDEYSVLKDAYQQAGFQEERREGFKGFYNDGRVLMHLDLPAEKDFEEREGSIQERSALSFN